MQFSLVNPPKIFARNSSGRMVQIAGHAGDIGKIANLVVPDERVIHRLRPVISYLQNLPPRHFEYGSRSGYSKHPQQSPNPLKRIQFNRTDDLPLFEKR